MTRAMRLRVAAATAAVALAGGLLAGCSGSSSGSATGGSAAGGSADGSAAGESTVAPFVIDADFPDPDVLKVGDEYHLYATNGAGFNVQQAVSTNLKSFEIGGADALPTLPTWAAPGRTWAPEVAEAADGSYLLYFTAASKNPIAQCIGVATSADPAGPFVAAAEAPLVCPAEDGGAIDASTFRDDDGTLYLLFKNDGNCCALDTWLQIAPLSADGLSLAAEPTKLVKQDQPWEGTLVEAPTLVKRGDTYVLLYSANDYGASDYAIGYATASSVLGAYTKGAEPLLTTESSGGAYLGPGGQDVVVGPDDADALVFHSWDEFYVQRGVHAVPLEFSDGVPAVVLPK